MPFRRGKVRSRIAKEKTKRAKKKYGHVPGGSNMRIQNQA